jgi:hypothetical protein
MLKRFFNFLYGDIPVRFPSDFALMKSVERLRERTRRSVFSALFRQAAVGPVSESRVRLQRVIPLFANSFKPIFVGRFHQSHGRVVLEGRFTMFLFSKIFMTSWMAFALVWTAVALAATLRAVGQNHTKLYEGAVALLVPLVGVLFFLVGVGFLRGCWWLSRNDMVFLVSVIEAALRDGTPTSATKRMP